MGTTVAFSTKASELDGIPQGLLVILIGSAPLNVPLELRVSNVRHGAMLYSAKPPVPTGAKYPLISITTSALLEATTLICPLVPAGTIAAFATTGSFDGAFSVETPGQLCCRPDAQVP